LAVFFFLIQDIVEAGVRKYNTISPMLTVTKLNTGHPIILDVREAGEYNKERRRIRYIDPLCCYLEVKN
jgi:hypothetical protein